MLQRKPLASMAKIFLLIALPVLCCAVRVSAHAGSLEPGSSEPRSFYVSPEGRSSATGTPADPWPLDTALGHPPAVHPGDTIWLLGGTYRGAFRSVLRGVSESPIVVRAVPGERVTIDGGNSNGSTILIVAGEYTWFWGLEITSSYGNRRSNLAGPSPSDVLYGAAIGIDQSEPHPGLKFINLVIHDTRTGYGWWQQATDSEIYGNVIFYNGWQGPDNGHGHGIYAQNQTSTRQVIDNIVFDQFGEGLQAYGTSSAYLNNFYLEGNTFFRNGGLGSESRNVLIGGANPAQAPILSSNYLYYARGGPVSALKLGYSGSECVSPILKNNFVANSVMVNCTSMSIDGNTFYGPIEGFTISQFPDNTYLSARPTGLNIFVRPNLYEPGRANLTVYNWDLSNTVDVDLSAILSPGDRFEIRNVQDYFGVPVVSGTFDGGKVTIPTTGLSVAAPVGWPAPPPTGPEFNAFVLLPGKPARQTPQPTARSPLNRTDPRVVERPAEPQP